MLNHQKRYAEAEEICRRQIPRTYVTGQRNTRYQLYEILSNALAGQGDYKEAYNSLLTAMRTRDTMLNQMSPDMSAVTSAFENRLLELEKIRAHPYHNRPAWWIMVLILLASGAVSIWVNRNLWRADNRRKQRQHNLWNRLRGKEVEHCLSQNSIVEDLNSANRRLISMSMEMAEKENILASVTEAASGNDTPPREKISRILGLLRFAPDSNHNWDVFRMHFEKVHPRFFANLHQAHPELTSGDIKMAAFIVKMSTKEIASMLCRSQRTVESARYRLHKKLGLEANEKSAQYLQTFM